MSVSGYLVCIFAIVLAIWDGVAVQHFGIKASVSWFMHSVGMRYPSFILAIGILIGHFFAAMGNVKQ